MKGKMPSTVSHFYIFLPDIKTKKLLMKAVMQSWEYARSTGRARSSLHAHRHIRERAPPWLWLVAAAVAAAVVATIAHMNCLHLSLLFMCAHLPPPCHRIQTQTCEFNALPSFLSSFPRSASLPLHYSYGTKRLQMRC